MRNAMNVYRWWAFCSIGGGVWTLRSLCVWDLLTGYKSLAGLESIIASMVFEVWVVDL